MPPVLVRRIVERPEAPPAGLHIEEGAGQPIRGAGHGPAVRRTGPYVISGGWWVRPIHREYHFVEVRRGDVLWVYYDRQRRRWFLQGAVE
jgi:protein ImuB